MRTHWVSAIVGAAALAASLSACGGGQPAAAETQPATAAAAASPVDPSNLIIGRWLFTSANNNPPTAPGGCSTEMTFTPTQWTQVQVGVSTTSNVHYYASAKEVYVVYPTGDHVTYNVLDQNHVQLDTFALCTYARAA
jgi:hypothetical protein